MPINRRITIGFAVSLFLMLVIFPSLNSETKGREKPEGASLADCATEVKSALAVKGKFGPAVVSAVTVEVTGRTATLTGTVNYSPTKTGLAKAAKGVACVKKVRNNIQVVRPLACQQGQIMCCIPADMCDCIPKGQICGAANPKRR
jgi:hypothetical protein